jgi:hypothetical protein
MTERSLSSTVVRGPERRPQGGREAHALVAGATHSCSGPRRAVDGGRPMSASNHPQPRITPRPFVKPRRPGTPPRLRLFVALDLPRATKREVDAYGTQALADPALRQVPAENLRITLVYLGHQLEGQVPRIVAALRDFCEGMASPLVELRDPEQRPERGRSRLYTLPATSPDAEVIQVGLRQLLSDRGLYEHDQRPILAAPRSRNSGRPDAGPRGQRNASRSAAGSRVPWM